MPRALDRRTLLQTCGLATLTTLVSAAASKAEEQKPKRRILAAGGGTLQPPNEERLLLRHLVALTGKKDPQICFLPTAGADLPQSIVNWYESTNDLGCRPRHLRLINNSTLLTHLEEHLLGMDAIFVGGGNTLSMLAVWKVHGVDAILRKAWERGVLLAGESAGLICWFERGVSDAHPGPLSAVDGLGFLKGTVCPHYHHKTRQADCHRLLLAGTIGDCLACDDGTALLYEDEKLVGAVGVSTKVGAWRVRKNGDKVAEEPLPIECLAK